MEEDGVKIIQNATIVSLSKSGEEKAKVVYNINKQINNEEDTFDVVLFATGRQPNTAGLALEKARVNYDRSGIIVNNNLRTSNNRVFSCGDCINGPKFTHNSDV